MRKEAKPRPTKRQFKIVAIEDKTSQVSWVTNTKTKKYVNGDSVLFETIMQQTTSRPHALLECGHWTEGNPFGRVLTEYTRLFCSECYALQGG